MDRGSVAGATYVFTWPPIEIISAKVLLRRALPPPPPSPSSLTKTGTGTWDLTIQPYGIRMLYRPLNKLAPADDSRRILTRYWNFWCGLLGEGTPRSLEATPPEIMR